MMAYRSQSWKSCSAHRSLVARFSFLSWCTTPPIVLAPMALIRIAEA